MVRCLTLYFGCRILLVSLVLCGFTLTTQLTTAATPPSSTELNKSSDDAAAVTTEIIREQHPNGLLNIERHVAQDPQGNYVNHGPWSMWDDKGQLVGRGTYRWGLRHGAWERHFRDREASMLSASPARDFTAPFVSNVSFVHGDLDGEWSVIDAQCRKVVCWKFNRGVRDGTSTWFFPNGQKCREVEYAKGEVVGQIANWTADGKTIAEGQLVEGRRTGVRIESYPSGATRIEAQYLFAKEVVDIRDDWWNGTSEVRIVEKQGKDQRHGRWIAFYQDGQKALEGEYQHDLPIGTFVWWHPTGQKAIEGDYKDGRQSGYWAWWYPSGQAQIRGEYLAGQVCGKWIWWKETGTIAQALSYDAQGRPSRSQSTFDTVVSIPDPQRLPTLPIVPTPLRTANRGPTSNIK